MIRCKNLRRTYDQRVVLDIPRLDIKKGSFFGVLGPNGAGKTTLLHILGGLDGGHQGKVTYFSGLHLEKQRVLLFQQPYMLRGSVFENIEYPLRLRKVAKKQRRQLVETQLEDFQLTALAHQKAATLSGGERQRVALAQALVFSPTLVLLDEPTASADMSSTQLMEDILVKHHQKGVTLVLITHNLAQAKRLCTEVCYLEEGRLIETGPPSQVLQHPRKKKTRDFISLQAL